jgi:tRNA threonylcarbamoyladenosine biosynthesis protein TsaB
VLAGLDPVWRAGSPAAIVIDSRRGSLFVQRFDARDAPEGAAAAIEPTRFADWLSELGGFVIAGDGAPLLAGAALPPGSRISAASSCVQATALARYAATGRAGDRPATPLYLREPDVTPPMALGT